MNTPPRDAIEEALAQIGVWGAICAFFGLTRTPDMFAEWREDAEYDELRWLTGDPLEIHVLWKLYREARGLLP